MGVMLFVLIIKNVYKHLQVFLKVAKLLLNIIILTGRTYR